MKKTFDCTLGEPWSSAQRALEKYESDMRQAPVHDVAKICSKHGPLMADITKKLPKNLQPRIFTGGSTTNLPYSAPELAQVLLKHLHQACRSEIVLAPEEWRETTAQLSALISAELAVCQLAELLDEAQAESASFLEELAVADSTERIVNQLHYIAEVVNNYTHELTYLYPDWDILIRYCVFLKQVGQTAHRSAVFMCQMLTTKDPLLSPATRMVTTAEMLIKEASKCREKARFLMRYDTGPVAAIPKKAGNGGKKSLIGLLASQHPGCTSLLLPSEERRRKRIDKRQKRRRERGGDHSTDEDISKTNEEEMRINHSKCKKCQTFFRDDSVFCHKCGNKRPDPPFASQIPKRDAGPPPLKRFGEDPDVVRIPEEDEEFTQNYLLGRSNEGEHSIWGGDQLMPSTRELEPRFKEGGAFVEHASDEENEASKAGSPGQRAKLK